MPKKISIQIPDRATPTAALAIDTIKIGKQALIFVNTKRSAEKTAEDIAKLIKTQNPIHSTLSEKAKRALPKPTKQCIRLAFCLNKGIAYHHAGLVHKQRELIEDNFRKGHINIICATPTLAFGMDLPAFRCIVRDLKRFSFGGMQPLPVLEVQQMFGRAGRPGKESYGQAICLAATDIEKQEIIDTYINGNPEPIESKLAEESVLRTYALSLISSGFARNISDLENIFMKSFWSSQNPSADYLKNQIETAIKQLAEWKFIEVPGPKTAHRANNIFISADKLIDSYSKTQKISSTPLGKRISELYIDPFAAHNIIKGLRNAPRKVSDFAYIHLICSSSALPLPFKPRQKELEILDELIIKNSDDLLVKEPPYHSDQFNPFMSSIKLTAIFSEWMDETDEDDILENFNMRPGELYSYRTLFDWIIFCASELAKLINIPDLSEHALLLQVRMKHGVKRELLPLLRFKNIGRIRARMLFRAGIKSIKDVKNSDFIRLAGIVGPTIAKNLKDQVGQSTPSTIRNQTTIKDS